MRVTDDFETLSADQFAALSVGHVSTVERLRLPGRFVIETAFVYPGKGPVGIQSRPTERRCASRTVVG